jgi:hypothetical protein
MSDEMPSPLNKTESITIASLTPEEQAVKRMSEKSFPQTEKDDLRTDKLTVELSQPISLSPQTPSQVISYTSFESEQLIRDLIRANATANPPPEWRESVKLMVAALLAIGFWTLLGWILFAQFQYSLTVSDKIEKSQNKDQITTIKDARDGVNQTSNSIYALLTPIAGSITGYFFVSSGSGKVLGNKKPQDTLPEKDSGQTPK